MFSTTLLGFFPLFWWLNTRYNMVLDSAYHQNCPYVRSAGLKNWRHASTNVAIDKSWFFTWKSFSGDRHLYLDAIKWHQKPDMMDLMHTKQLLNLFCIVYIHGYIKVMLTIFPVNPSMSRRPGKYLPGTLFANLAFQMSHKIQLDSSSLFANSLLKPIVVKQAVALDFTCLSLFAIWIMGNIIRVSRQCSLILCPPCLSKIGWIP